MLVCGNVLDELGGIVLDVILLYGQKASAGIFLGRSLAIVSGVGVIGERAVIGKLDALVDAREGVEMVVRGKVTCLLYTSILSYA